ncbi:MAG: GNAT family N-acetyltransferase [Clostridiales bacterium]|jgi:GNAT superfamily N-acetyltransferase|nr:GNAT family N-acetyltransferase [Clostridiales bacterium]
MTKYYDTTVADLKIRTATEKDTSAILEFIKGLAEYENMSDEVVATEEMLHDSLFIKKQAEVILAEYKDEPIGFALFFHNFSTFLGKANLYLEDLFVKPEARGLGAGKVLLTCLAKIAVERDCGRLDWLCLDWNKSSIDLYIKLGAKPLSEWTVFRVEGQALQDLANKL